jgi:G6PDH family F420-dependent oxidoreductase
VWTVLGGIGHATRALRITTAVTCPTLRTHPAIVAQAAATTATLLPGRFALGVGSGEALNEHILGDRWPRAAIRLEMLEEAVEIIRELWTGRVVNHRGRHYEVDHARIYSRPDEPPPIYVSGFGPKAIALAGRIGDGYVNTSPDADMLAAYRDAGGRGPAQGGMKVCWAESEAQARRTAHRIWPNEVLPGELAQVLPTPEHFEQASSLATEDMVAEAVPCGPDPERHAAAIQEYLDAGYDEVYVQQIGSDQEGFLRFYEREILPRFR